MVWAIEPLRFGADFVFNRARQVRAAAGEPNPFAVFAADEEAEIGRPRVAKREGSAGFEVALLADERRFECPFRFRKHGIGGESGGAQRESSAGEGEKFKELTAGHEVVFLPVDGEIGF